MIAHRAQRLPRKAEKAAPHCFPAQNEPVSDLIMHIGKILAMLENTPGSPGPRERAGADFLKLAKRAYRCRRQREVLFGSQLFADPAWDVLLDLFIAAQENRRVSVKSACVAASVPSTTALRYIGQLVEQGLVERQAHPTDSRSTHLTLTDLGRARMADYFRFAATASDAARA